ncbi:hypothetical protein [Clostridium luticellarii]|uniref:hypothetical protein n=1 Tax=Clostridium luticellarii TaxID=1691940 RepID=UPI001FA9200C|nr:hypothetical protein [Clostridium luticellarii]
MINMSQYITSQNLNEVIEANKKIRNKIESFKSDFFINYNKIGITGFDRLAFEVLKKNYNLIQLPIDDEYWGEPYLLGIILKYLLLIQHNLEFINFLLHGMKYFIYFMIIP